MIGMVGPSSAEAGGKSRTSLSKLSMKSTSRAFNLLRDSAKMVFGYEDRKGTGNFDEENSNETRETTWHNLRKLDKM